MLKIEYVVPSPLTGAGQFSLSGNPAPPGGRRRLRLYLVGSEADTQQTIDYLHVRGCIERIKWSRAIAIPENGIVIQRDPGNVLRYLQQDRQFD